MRSLLAAGLLLAAFALPVGAKAADPFLTLDTPGPYHYGETITVTAHGDIPGKPDERDAKTWIKLWCFQGGTSAVFIQHIFSPAAETPYTMNLGQWGISQWDLNGGGPADCQLWFGRLGHSKPGVPYTIIDFHVEP